MARISFGAFMLLVCFSLLGALQAFAVESVTVQGGGMNREVALGMTKADLISSIGAPSRVKSEGYCLQYDTFDMSVFLDENMRVERIYLGRDFKGGIGGKSGPERVMSEVYRDYGSPRTTERLTYSPSPSLRTTATVELEDKVSYPPPSKMTAFPLEYRGDRVMYELYSHDMVMKYKYVSDTEGVAFWMDHDGAVYAAAIYPSYPPKRVAMARVALGPVYFDFDKDSLKKEYLGTLNRDSDLIKEQENLLVTIGGHTDNKGSAAYNQTLSERRAKSVYDYLTQKGVSPSQLKTVGCGELRPVADNRTKEGRAKNRRVELEADEDPVHQGKTP